jgi:lysophospholipase L1-like esterase
MQAQSLAVFVRGLVRGESGPTAVVADGLLRVAIVAACAMGFPHCGSNNTPQTQPNSTPPTVVDTDGSSGATNQGDMDSGAGAAVPEAAVIDNGSPGDAASADTGAKSGGGIEGGPTMEAGTGAYSPCPTDGSPCKILPLGDSITYGIQYAGAYRVQLFQDTLNAHQKITFVGDPSLANGPTMVGGVSFPQDNDGHSGWTIDQIASLVPSPALQTNPDIILLMIGTNDMYSQSQPVAQAPMRLGALLDKIFQANTHALLVVAQITPLQNSTWEMQVQTYNAAIPALVQARATAGKHIALADMHTGFMVATMLSSDGVHPNMTGYDHMGDVWYAAIKGVLH